MCRQMRGTLRLSQQQSKESSSLTPPRHGILPCGYHVYANGTRMDVDLARNLLGKVYNSGGWLKRKSNLQLESAGVRGLRESSAARIARAGRLVRLSGYRGGDIP